MAYRKNVRVTIPSMDIDQKQAFLISEGSKRFRVWWNSKGTSTKHQDCDISVPNSEIIIEY